MQRCSFVSCLPALFAQLGFRPDSNPGEIPVTSLTLLGVIAVREQQLENAQNVAEQMAVTADGLAVELEITDLVMSEASKRLSHLQFLYSSARGESTFQRDRADRHRASQYIAEDELVTAQKALAESNSKLAAAESKLAGINAALGKSEESGPPPDATIN